MVDRIVDAAPKFFFSSFLFLSFPSVLSFCRVPTFMPSSKRSINSVIIHDPKEETPRLLICRVEEKMLRSSNERARCVINGEAFEKKRTRQKRRKKVAYDVMTAPKRRGSLISRLSAHKELFVPMSSVQVIDLRQQCQQLTFMDRMKQKLN